MESIPYIFPFEPPQARYLKFNKIKTKCDIDYYALNRSNYSSLMEALKMDELDTLRHLITSNGMPERWLDFRLPDDCQEFVIFNVLIEKGYKKIEEGKNNIIEKLIYGHHFLLIFPLPEDSSVFCYSEIKNSIKKCIKSTKKRSKFPFFSKHPSTEYNFQVQLLINFNHEYNVPFPSIRSIFQNALQQSPPHLIKKIKAGKKPSKSKEPKIKAIQLLTMLFQVKNLISKNFPSCSFPEKQGRIMSAKMSAFSISKSALNLGNAIKHRRLHAVEKCIKSIFSHTQIIESRMKEKLEKYFEQTRKFPNLEFADDLMRNLKNVYEILKLNLAYFRNKWFFQWNESTKKRITFWDSGDGMIGIIVTAKNFPSETFYHHFNDGKLFWAIQESSNSEPLLYFNNNEQNFGIISSPSSPTSTTLSQQISSGLLIDLCQCGSEKIRYWICEECHRLITRLSKDKINCTCQKQVLADAKKYCFQCIHGKSNNGMIKDEVFEEHPCDSLSTTSTAMNSMSIKIVQIKREKISEKSTYATSQASSKATLAIPESDESDLTLDEIEK